MKYVVQNSFQEDSITPFVFFRPYFKESNPGGQVGDV